jgi:hypothetical protein
MATTACVTIEGHVGTPEEYPHMPLVQPSEVCEAVAVTMSVHCLLRGDPQWMPTETELHQILWSGAALATSARQTVLLRAVFEHFIGLKHEQLTELDSGNLIAMMSAALMVSESHQRVQGGEWRPDASERRPLTSADIMRHTPSLQTPSGLPVFRTFLCDAFFIADPALARRTALCYLCLLLGCRSPVAAHFKQHLQEVCDGIGRTPPVCGADTRALLHKALDQPHVTLIAMLSKQCQEAMVRCILHSELAQALALPQTEEMPPLLIALFHRAVLLHLPNPTVELQALMEPLLDWTSVTAEAASHALRSVLDLVRAGRWYIRATTAFQPDLWQWENVTLELTPQHRLTLRQPIHWVNLINLLKCQRLSVAPAPSTAVDPPMFACLRSLTSCSCMLLYCADMPAARNDPEEFSSSSGEERHVYYVTLVQEVPSAAERSQMLRVTVRRANSTADVWAALPCEFKDGRSALHLYHPNPDLKHAYPTTTATALGDAVDMHTVLCDTAAPVLIKRDQWN